MNFTNTLNLQHFYPEELKIISIEETNSRIIIHMQSQKHRHSCQQCGAEMTDYHSTYNRSVQDLPIFGKNVTLQIRSYEYDCNNTDCEQKVFSEDYEGFIGRYGRMTARCEELIKTIAYETSCECAAFICSCMGIKISGDTIIRMLIQHAGNNPVRKCSEEVGVDDFAYRKGQKYCTIVCDNETRRPVAVLNGRDGKELKEWLKENKHIKKVTRDRAGAYAKAISEILPEAMQIADRFHLHQNLLDAIKDTLRKELPNKIPIYPDIEIQKAGIEQSSEKPNEKRGKNLKGKMRH